MQIAWLRHEDNWQDVKNAAMNTVGKDKGVYPTAAWKKKILLAEHSPIRLMQFAWKWSDLPYWVSVHIVRHKIGIEHFVSTQRTDRTGVDRTERPQNAPVLHQCQANAQALITISRKRLCSGASAETRQAWQLLKDEIAKVEPELASCMEVFPQVLINVRVSNFGKVRFDSDEEIKIAIAAAEEELGDSGRVLVRVSGTEPLVRVMLEGRDEKQIQRLGESIAEVVRERLI